ncbi:hypothetical protein CHELA1G11_11914 [Hyphomicrobiales bacterium]|nr:hypothetical protein CHELA1G11_11914 [Hyphomicrobiales bacterium]CAH1664587.1 hypothetical protein CHELA1G2_12397 [Hyphomicrobiales bacterium]
MGYGPGLGVEWAPGQGGEKRGAGIRFGMLALQLSVRYLFSGAGTCCRAMDAGLGIHASGGQRLAVDSVS